MASKKRNTSEDEIPEKKVGSSPAPVSRNVWAIDTLIGEVESVFPGTEAETGAPNMFNANMIVAFTAPEKDIMDDLLLLLLTLEEVDERIKTVQDGGEGTVIVGIVANPTLRDSREPFGLKDAALGLVRSAGEADDEGDES